MYLLIDIHGGDFIYQFDINNVWIVATVSAILAAFIVALAMEKLKNSNINSHIKSRINNADDLFGKNLIIDALSAYKSLLDEVSEKKDPLKYAYINQQKGSCYYLLAEEDGTEDNLNKAIQAYEVALKIRTVEKYPISYVCPK